MRSQYKEYKNFFSLEECSALINKFKKNVQHHETYRDTTILKLKEASPRLIDTFKKDFNIILNYGQIVFNSQKMEHGVEEVIGDRFTYISWCKKK